MRSMAIKSAGLALGLFALAVLAWAPVARAATPAELEAKIRNLEQQMDSLKGELKQVQTSQQQTQVLAEQASEKKLPGWMERMTFYGDTRMRLESTSYDDRGGKDKEDKERLRLRLRFGLKSQISESWELGFRMVTGADSDGTSTNQTLGGWWGEKGWGIDTAYFTYTPVQLDKMLAFSFGKMKNPFVTSKAIWDGDVVPEGAFLQLAFNKKGTVQPFINAGYLYVEDAGGPFDDDLFAMIGQVGIKAKLGKFKFTVATSYYDWGDLGEAGFIPGTVQHGNTVYAQGEGDSAVDRMSSFAVWDVYAKGSYSLTKKSSISLWGHYLVNLDEDVPEPYDGEDSGYAAGVSFKYDKFKAGIWYKSVEANATPSFIADSDSGYTNREGFVYSIGYQMFKRASITLSYFDMQAVDEDLPGTSNNYQTFFCDFVLKF